MRKKWVTRVAGRTLTWAMSAMLVSGGEALAQQGGTDTAAAFGVLSAAQRDALFSQPKCLQGWRTNQTGPLHRIGAREGEPDDSTFTVEQIKILSDGLLIHGWLFLPRTSGKVPLVVLTNGGGDASRPIKSLSDWLAPILSHCGIAAFVHDKRGTGLSQGKFTETSYDDYARDAGNAASQLSRHGRVDPRFIGVVGGSEGGRIAVLAASRYPEIAFVVSFAGTVVSMEDDRMFATMGGFRARGVSDSVINEIKPLWAESFAAWARNTSTAHDEVNKKIVEWRKRFSRDLLPFTKEEMESIPAFAPVLPTWKSMPNDYLTELGHFRKKWLAVFGEIDQVVPTQASVRNILRYMALSGNTNFAIAVIPKIGHSPVDVETNRMVRLDNMIINWIDARVLGR